MKINHLPASIFILYFFFVVTMPGDGFAEELSDGEKTKQLAMSEAKKQKPDISMEMVDTPNETYGKDADETFDDFDFGETYSDGEKEIYDPLEPINRIMWTFNETLYDNVLDPVARGYGKVVPKPLRINISNFFSNLKEPVAVVSSALQNNKDKVDRSIGRFLINSTLGVGGVFDPADKIFSLKKANEDFDQALGYHNVPEGAFLMLPLFGPSTTRGLIGTVSQMFLSPEYFFGIDFWTSLGIRSEEMVNGISLNLGQKEELDSIALDSYTSLKDFYIKRRRILVKE